MKLRPYQQEVIGSLMLNRDNALIKAPTGAGKTVMMAHYLKHSEGPHLVLAHRTILIKQARDMFLAMGVDDVDVMTYQTAVRREASMRPYKNIVIDEVHRLPPTDTDSSYSRILGFCPTARLVGFTATPFRLGTGYIFGTESSWFEDLTYDIELKDLMEQGYLSPYKYFVTASIDVSNVRRTGGEYNLQDLGEEMAQERHLGSVAHALDEKAKGRSHIAVFAVTIAHAEALAERLNGLVLHSKQTKNVRKNTLETFKRNGGVLISVGALTEGWDEPQCDCIVLARPTLSPALYVQMVGRGLRLSEGKADCLVLDMVGCYNRHGSINDPHVCEPSERGEATEQTQRDEICQECGSIMPSPPTCDVCGHTNQSMAEIRHIEEKMRLEEINEGVATLENISADWFTSRSGNKCLRFILFTKEHGRINLFFAVYSSKVTPRRKIRKAVKHLFGHDLGSDYEKWEGLRKAIVFNKLKRTLVGVNKGSSGYWEAEF